MTKTNTLRNNLVRLTKIHFIYLLVFGLAIIAYHAWRLLAPDALKWHWISVGVISLILSFTWLQAGRKNKNPGFYKRLVWLLIAADVALAAFVVYAQRGVASRGVALFAIPIVVATVFRSRAALAAISILSALAYIITSLIYAAVYPRESYKIELYGTLAFYSATFFLLAALLWVFTRSVKGK